MSGDGTDSRRRALIRASERIQRDAWNALSLAATPEARARFGIRAEMIGSELYQAARAIPIIQFNKIYSFGLDETLTDGRLDAARTWVEDHCAGCAWVMVPYAEEVADLDARFARRGLVRYPADNAVLCLDQGACPVPTPSSSVDVRPVPVPDAHLFGAVLSEALGIAPEIASIYASLVASPGFTAYLAHDGATPIAGAAMFRAGDRAWLFLAATIPRFRNRGAQTALLARRVADGRAQGVQTFDLGTRCPEPGLPDTFSSYRNARRAGFEPAYVRRVYVSAR